MEGSTEAGCNACPPGLNSTQGSTTVSACTSGGPVWRQFGGDHTHSGRSLYTAPKSPVVLQWIAPLSAPVTSAAVLMVQTASGDAVVALTKDAGIVAVNASGSLVFSLPSISKTDLVVYPVLPLQLSFTRTDATKDWYNPFLLGASDGSITYYGKPSRGSTVPSAGAVSAIRTPPTFDGYYIWWGTEGGALKQYSLYTSTGTPTSYDPDSNAMYSYASYTSPIRAMVAVKLKFISGSFGKDADNLPQYIDISKVAVYHVFYGNTHGTLVALDVKTGNNAWTSPDVNPRPITAGTPIVDVLYDQAYDLVIVTAGQSLYAVDATDGGNSNKWTSLGTSLGTCGTPVLGISGDVWIICYKDGVSMATQFSLISKSQTFSITVCQCRIVAAPVVDSNGLLVVGDMSGNVWAFSKTTAPYTMYTTDGPILASVVIAPGALYVGAKSLFALTTCPSPMAWDASSSSCQPCARGYALSSTTGVCEVCAAGSVSVGNQATCTPCARGYYSAFAGGSTCLPCEAGTYSNKTGAAQCVSRAAPRALQQHVRV